MKNKIISTFLFTLFVVGAGCSAEVQLPVAEKTKEPATVAVAPVLAPPYTHTKFGFSIQPPLNWIPNEIDPQFHLIMKNDHADKATETVNYRSNINLKIVSLTNGNMQETAAGFKKGVANGWDSATFTDETTKTLNGAETYTTSVELTGDGYTVKGLCEIVRADATQGVLVCGYSLANTWDENKNKITESLATFKP